MSVNPASNNRPSVAFGLQNTQNMQNMQNMQKAQRRGHRCAHHGARIRMKPFLVVILLAFGANSAAATSSQGTASPTVQSAIQQVAPKSNAPNIVLHSITTRTPIYATTFTVDNDVLILGGVGMATGLFLGIGLYGVTLLLGLDISKQAFAGVTQTDVNNRDAQLIGGVVFSGVGFAGAAAGGLVLWLLLEE